MVGAIYFGNENNVNLIYSDGYSNAPEKGLNCSKYVWAYNVSVTLVTISLTINMEGKVHSQSRLVQLNKTAACQPTSGPQKFPLYQKIIDLHAMLEHHCNFTIGIFYNNYWPKENTVCNNERSEQVVYICLNGKLNNC